MINKVILLGHVGKDPEVRHLDNDRTVARFTLATSESYKSKTGERVTNTEWHNIICWRGLADIAGRFVKKGTMLYVEGKIRNRSYDDKDGNKRYITEIEADNFQMIGRRPEENQQNSGFSQQGQYSQPTSEQDNGFNYSQAPEASDDLPF